MDKVLIERLDHLERECHRLGYANRRLKGAGIAMLMIGAVVLAAGGAQQAGDPKAVVAERFVLQDREGRRRAELGFTLDGTPRLALYDQQEKARIGMAVGPDGSTGMTFIGPDDRDRIGMGTNADGMASIIVFDGTGRQRAKMEVRPDGSPSLILMDEDGSAIYRAPGGD